MTIFIYYENQAQTTNYLRLFARYRLEWAHLKSIFFNITSFIYYKIQAQTVGTGMISLCIIL